MVIYLFIHISSHIDTVLFISLYTCTTFNCLFQIRLGKLFLKGIFQYLTVINNYNLNIVPVHTVSTLLAIITPLPLFKDLNETWCWLIIHIMLCEQHMAYIGVLMMIYKYPWYIIKDNGICGIRSIGPRSNWPISLWSSGPKSTGPEISQLAQKQTGPGQVAQGQLAQG